MPLLSTIHVDLPVLQPRSYDIVVGRSLVSEMDRAIRAINPVACVIITDTHLRRTYASSLARRIRRFVSKTIILSMPHGEGAKNQTTKTALERAMLGQRCGRDTVIVALGGGVVGDVAGFVAATYLRGIPYIQVPTTLLAMVDSSIGGKTGIDTPEGKNLIGAFWQPSRVIIDVQYLQTLSQPQITSGMMEAVKMFITSDPASLEIVGRFRKTHRLQDAIDFIRRAVTIKAGVIARDETEQGQRAVLNFGHTIGHALEQVSGYRIHHGLAVGVGVLVEAKIAQTLGVLPEKEFDKIQEVLAPWNLPFAVLRRYSSTQIINATKNDKKVRAGQTRYVLLEKIGKVYVNNGQYAHPLNDAIVKIAYLACLA
ncbi:3-dehydroquinate synthase [Candidatus Uhrbacteria bacterium]|nr:3-dehydroquinate synthase [Candidatus Uhrbacteria bacterium]